MKIYLWLWQMIKASPGSTGARTPAVFAEAAWLGFRDDLQPVRLDARDLLQSAVRPANADAPRTGLRAQAEVQAIMSLREEGSVVEAHLLRLPALRRLD